MCGRLSLGIPPRVIEDRFGARPPQSYQPRYNVAPGDDLAVIRDQERIDLLEWGLVPAWADEPGSGHVNARAETLADKPSFREAYEERRCLVLADGYYEWADERGRGKQPYRVTRTDKEPFAMAGLWERWEGNGERRETVTIVTTEPNEVVESIHDRMPVVLDPDEEETWIEEDDATVLDDLLDPFPEEETRAYPISEAVNDPANDTPELLKPADPPEQRGLEDFS